MKYVNSSSSISTTISNSGIDSLSSLSSPSSSGHQFDELVEKLFSCNIILVQTDYAKQFVKNCFGSVSFAHILNQFSNVNNLRLTIRDLNGHNAYALNKLRFRFYDVEQFKNRPNGAQLQKLHFDVISSMSNSYLNDQNLESSTGGDGDTSGEPTMINETPWYDLWKNIYIDTFEPSDHDFIGSSCGCFFVITKNELPHYKVIFERLCASVKQNSSLRFIQSDFVRYFIVLSDQVLEPTASNSDEFTRTCQNMKLEFPNSFVLYCEHNDRYTTLSSSTTTSLSSGSSGNIKDQQDGLVLRQDLLNNDLSNLNLNDNSNNNNTSIDPLSAAFEMSRNNNHNSNSNSTFYNELVSQRQHNHQQSIIQRSNSSNSNTGSGNNNTDASGKTTGSSSARDLIISEWISSNLYTTHEHLKDIVDSISETINLMLGEFISKSLIPWAERQIKIIGESVAQRKGFRKSLFNATKTLISGMSSSTASLTKSITGSYGGIPGATSGVIYIPDAQEMQQRKLADICMIFGVYEMAHSLYYAARKDFHSEGAWLYYAGASEMAAVASKYINRLHQNYFEQAITTYMETSINLATRSTILATELLCQLNRHSEAATLYIRMAGDDSDLRSALFLEQASRCFLTVSPKLTTNLPTSTSQALLSALSMSTNIESVGSLGSKYRKAAFHYILAGHRYNRCGLKHFALTCYRRYNYPNWESASDHVNQTVAKLFLTIASGNSRGKYVHYYRKGLEIYRSNSYKQLFFQEFCRELKRLTQVPPSTQLDSSHCDSMSGSFIGAVLGTSTESNCSDDQLYRLEIPFVHEFRFVSLDSLQSNELPLLSSVNSRTNTKDITLQRNCCFVGEPVEMLFTLSLPFALVLTNLKLICDRPETDILLSESSEQFNFTESNQIVHTLLKITALVECEFSIQGIEYTVPDGLRFRRYFPAKLQSLLNFNSVKTLPLISIDIVIPQLNVDTTTVAKSAYQNENLINIPVPVYQTENLTMKIWCKNCQSTDTTTSWSPSTIKLFTNAKVNYLWTEDANACQTLPEDSERKEYPVPINYGDGPLEVPLQIPPQLGKHTVLIRLCYSGGPEQKSRTVLRKICFEIIPLINIWFRLDQVVTLQNLSHTEDVAIFDCTIGEIADTEDITRDLTSMSDAMSSSHRSLDSRYILIPANQLAHLLQLKPYIRWTITNKINGLPRNGVIIFSLDQP